MSLMTLCRIAIALALAALAACSHLPGTAYSEEQAAAVAAAQPAKLQPAAPLAAIIREQGVESLVAKAVGNDLKGKLSPLMYLIAIPSAFVNRWIAGALYVAVALMWLLPDRRIERVLAERSAVS